MADPIIIGDDAPQEAQKSKDNLESMLHFVTPVYKINKPEFLSSVNTVMQRMIDDVKKQRKLHPIYPVYQTDNMLGDPDIKPLADYIGSTAWNILESQGYNMNGMSVFFNELWGQEHHKHSAHEEHVHGHGAQIVGFYFLDVPKDSSRLIIHDPRPAKKIINLPEVNMSQVTMGSNAVNFEAKQGDLFFMPSWVPHGLSRHSAKKPIKFIHFTIGVSGQQPTIDIDTGLPPSIAEVV
jgi:hypothetical protein